MRTDESSGNGKKFNLFPSELPDDERMLRGDAFEETDGIVKDSEQKQRDDDWHSFERV